MNYGQYAIIGIGTAGLGLWVAQAIGLPQAEAGTLLTGAGIIALGSIAVDIDHPSAFISRGLLLEILERALPLLSLPATFALIAVLSGGAIPIENFQSWFHVSFVRWVGIVVGLSLALMFVSRTISGTLKHRGPLHPFVFGVIMTAESRDTSDF
jgi:hypothetical protein